MIKVISFIFRMIILFYKGAISPLLAPRCRYTPNCSDYGLQAIQKHGPFKGGWLTLKRISSCHPLGGQGHDPIP
jgi:putative membrane protein insertion efficiency factor